MIGLFSCNTTNPNEGRRIGLKALNVIPRPPRPGSTGASSARRTTSSTIDELFGPTCSPREVRLPRLHDIAVACDPVRRLYWSRPWPTRVEQEDPRPRGLFPAHAPRGGTDLKAFTRLELVIFRRLLLKLPADSDFSGMLLHGADERVPVDSPSLGCACLIGSWTTPEYPVADIGLGGCGKSARPRRREAAPAIRGTPGRARRHLGGRVPHAACSPRGVRACR